jgi:hypothetical protein
MNGRLLLQDRPDRDGKALFNPGTPEEHDPFGKGSPE